MILRLRKLSRIRDAEETLGNTHSQEPVLEILKEGQFCQAYLSSAQNYSLSGFLSTAFNIGKFNIIEVRLVVYLSPIEMLPSKYGNHREEQGDPPGTQNHKQGSF